MSQLSGAQRDQIVSAVLATVEAKHFNHLFEKERWRAAIQRERARLLSESAVSDFEGILDGLVRSFGVPDAGFFHERARKKIPRGVAARFQYCQPTECAPSMTQATEGGDVMITKFPENIGWIKVTKFPGAVGIDIAKQIDSGIQQLRECRRIVLDLRGNAGGGLAFLRVMSYLTPERLPVGYSVTRTCAERGYSKESLAAFNHIPSHKSALIWLAVKFGFRDDSVKIITEGLGSQPFHGKIVVLTDATTTGAGERIAAFARERNLGCIVGTRTAGRLICCSVYKVGQGYYVRVPARAWYTWSGDQLEGRGVEPDYEVTDGDGTRDFQLDRAIEIARDM
ncbi:MAG: hypothetical protein K2X03_02115 [Bryobacteraceae bacterium]|nr:hypothetical protein [Bryobacteraceae bacterium]